MRSLLALAFCLCEPFALAADPVLLFDLTMVEGSGDAPMIVAWVEKTDGTFVRSLHMFNKDKKYYKEMLTWSSAREGRETEKELDAVVGPTPAWGSHQVVRVPAAGILEEGMVLRIEQRKDKGGHYKKRKLPLAPDWPGATLTKEGYLANLMITVER